MNIAGLNDRKDFDFSKTIARELGSSRQRIIKAGLILFFCASILLSWWLTLHQLYKSKSEILMGIKREQNNLTCILSENLFQVLDQNHSIALYAQRLLAPNEKMSWNVAQNLITGELGLNRVVLYDLSGDSFYQSSPGHNNYIKKDDIKRYINEMAKNGLPVNVKAPEEHFDTSWQIPILFPLKHRGKILGAMLIEFDIGYILRLFQGIDIGRTGRITIRNERGDALARFESGGFVWGKSFPNYAFTDFMVKKTGSGVFTYSDHETYYSSYRHVHTYPFVITVSQRMDEILSDFGQYKKQQLFILTLLTSFLLAGLYMVLAMINRKQGYLNDLAASNMKNNELLVNLEKEHNNAIYAASYDALTGLYNRRLFISLCGKNLLKAKRNRLSYAVLFIDLDRFKMVNDTLGHRIGDLLLKTVANRLKSCTRESDIVARFGGDEFVILLTEMTSEKAISPIVEKIISVVSKPCDNLDGHQINTSPSIGIAICPRDGEDIDTLIVNADAAMYKSKRAGRSRYSFFDTSLNTVSIEKFELEQRMPSAIENGEFTLHYQPKIELKTYEVVGMEALIRWDHPEHQLIYPDKFIETAEQNGLIVMIGNWVLEEACRQKAKWRDEGLNSVPVAVNVSPIELREEGYAVNFFNILRRNKLQPGDIEVEITENAFIEDEDIVINNLNTLHQSGVRISLDDFGSGFSNLKLIRSLPLSALKIDRSFIRDVRNSYNDNAIVSSTIALAKSLSLTIIAEGIESHDQLVYLKVAGCDQVQGYYFSRPVSEEKIRQFISSPARRLSA